MFVHYSQCFSGHLEHLWLQLGILDMSFLKENANWRVPLDFGFWICWSIISLCQSIFKKSTSPTDLRKMECTFLVCSIVRIVVGKTEKKQNRFLRSARKFWLKNHVRWLHEMEFWPSKIVQNGPTKTQREKSILCSLLFAFWVPKKHILHHCGIRKKTLCFMTLWRIHLQRWICGENLNHHELLIHQTYKLMVQKSHSQPPLVCIPNPVF